MKLSIEILPRKCASSSAMTARGADTRLAPSVPRHRRRACSMTAMPIRYFAGPANQPRPGFGCERIQSRNDACRGFHPRARAREARTRQFEPNPYTAITWPHFSFADSTEIDSACPSCKLSAIAWAIRLIAEYADPACLYHQLAGPGEGRYQHIYRGTMIGIGGIDHGIRCLCFALQKCIGRQRTDDGNDALVPKCGHFAGITN